MGKNYMLINPYIEGSFKKIYNAENSIKAAEKCYNNLSQHFTNSVKKFQFSLLKLNSSDVKKGETNLDLDKYFRQDKSNKLKNSNFSHFIVYEKKKGDKVNYSINSLDTKINNDHINKLTSNVIKIQKKYKNVLNAKYKKKSSKKQTKKSKSKRKNFDDSSDNYDDDDSSDSSYIEKSYYSDPLFWYWHYYLGIYPYNGYYLPTLGPWFSPAFYIIDGSSSSSSSGSGSGSGPSGQSIADPNLSSDGLGNVVQVGSLLDSVGNTV